MNKDEAQEFLKIAGETGMKMGRHVFCLDELQEAMIQVKKGRLKEPNAVIRLSR